MLWPSLSFSALHPHSFKGNQDNISFWLDKEFLQTEELLIIFKWCIQLNRGASNNLIKKNIWIYFSSMLVSKSNFIYSSQPLRINWIIALVPPAAKLKPLLCHNLPGHGTAPLGYWTVSFLWLKCVYIDIYKRNSKFLKVCWSCFKACSFLFKHRSIASLPQRVTNSSSECLNEPPKTQYLWGRQSQKVRLSHLKK